MATNMTGGLRRLSELDDYEVETGYPDIRGWRLEDAAGRNLGSVTDLLIDTRRGEAVSVMIHRKDRSWFVELFTEEENGRLPLSAIDLDEANRVVRVTQPIEQVMQGRAEGYDETRARGETRAAADMADAGEADRTVDVVEERLEIEKARQKAGEVRIGKTVETEQVRRQVPVERDEVIVERERLDQPIAASEAAGAMTGRDDEIIVPIYREEVEVTTRPVIAERLRIRKRSVQETREVSAEVRRERAVVEGVDNPTTEGQEGQKGGPTRRRRA